MSSTSHREGSIAEVTLLSVRQVADVLGVHPRSVWRLAQTGDIPAPIRLSDRVIRWRLTDLRDRLEEMAAGAKGVGR